MAYENGKTYWICPINNTGVALSVYGNSQVSQNRNVFLYTKQDIADQLWHLEIGNGFARLKSDLNQSYALNIYLGTSNYNNCDIHTWADNLEDSKINFRTINANSNTYRIQNYHDDADNDLYLTANAATSGSNVVWAKNNGGNLQVWKLIEKTSGSSTGGTRTQIDLPSNRTYCWSQFDSSITSICSNYGCSLTCILDIANIFGPKAFSAEDVRAACGWNSNGVVSWTLPSACSGRLNASGYSGSSSRGNVLAVAKEQIQKNNPIIIKIVSPQNYQSTHFVVAYGYTGTGTATSDFLVLDPGTGTKCTLSKAMANNYNKTTLYNYILAVR